MQQLGRHSLYAKLILAFVLVLLIPTVVISTFTFWRTRAALTEQAASEQLQLAEARADAVKEALTHSAADLLFAVQAPALRRFARGEPGAVSNVALHFKSFLADTADRYSGLCLLDPTGDEVVCVRGSPGGHARVAESQLASRHDQPFFINALRRGGIPGDGRVEISAVDLAAPAGPLVRYSTLIEDEAGATAGVVVLEAPAAQFFALLTDPDPRVVTLLVEPDGRFLATPQGAAPGGSLLDRQPGDAETILRQPQGMLLASADLRGHLQVFTRVRPVGQSAIQWTVLYQQPLDGIVDDVREIWVVNLALAAAALAVALAAALALARDIVRPVEALAAAADRVGSGDLHAPIPHAGADEIAALGGTLERTVARLREAVETAEQRRQEAETLGAATRAISTSLSIERVLELILSELRKVVPYDSASLQVVDGDSVRLIGSYGLVRAENIIGSRFSLVAESSPNAEVARARAPVILADAPARYPHFSTYPYREDPILSWLGVPLLFGERLIGMITLDKHQRDFYTPEYARLAMDFAAQAAIALENARLYEEARTELAERRRAEAANDRLAAIIEATIDAVGMADPAGNLLYLNRSFRALASIPEREEVGRLNISALVPEGQRERLFGELLPATVEHGSWVGEMSILSRDGAEIPVSQVLIAHYAPDGRPEYFSTIIRDMRERHRVEEELRQAQKMEALGRLAGGLAHDFNNLLTVILGECDLVLSDVGRDDPNYPSMEQIRQSGTRAAALTRQLLAFSRRQVLQPELLDLNEVIAGMEQMLRRLIGEDISLTIALAHNLPSVRADSGQVEQVVMNLAINARDAMPDGGRLLIETMPAEIGPDEARQHPEVVPGPHAMIAVTDTGVGIGEGDRDHIFEPFFTTKPRGKGTGLGLATVHGIVRQSGGHIWFYSEPGFGSTFKVYLPAVAGAAAAASAEPAEQPERAITETVLLVEDDDHVRTLARTILARAGFTVLEASDGQAALALAESHPGPIEALLTDVVMPGGLNGVQVAAAVRNLRAAIGVVYMSGYTDNALVGRSLVDTSARYLQKPFTPDALVGALLETLAQQRTGRV